MAGDTAKGLEAAAGMDESLGVREALLTLGTTSRDLSMGAARTHTAQALLLTATAAAVVAADGVARGGPRDEVQAVEIGYSTIAGRQTRIRDGAGPREAEEEACPVVCS